MPTDISILRKKHRFIDLLALSIIAMTLITSSLFGAVNVSAELRQKVVIKKLLSTTPVTHTNWILSNVQRQFLLSVIAMRYSQ